MIVFEKTFAALTGHPPFPWQRALYDDWFAKGKIPPSCNLPTGLGKTSVIAVWLIAFANGAAVPRRLVYVVNRRTVVDQTTDEVEKYKKNLTAAGITDPLAVSTLRGQFADNREWSADPSRPAVICGTVDMIGSRLLFSGYGVCMKGKPLHAGFLGQDSLIVHDEAHLEPAFLELLLAIEKEQASCKDFKPLKVMELTATRRGSGDVFELTKKEADVPPGWETRPDEPIRYVWQRLMSKKALGFLPASRDTLAKKIGETARKWNKEGTSGKAVLVFVRYVDDVKTVYGMLTDKKNGGVEASQVQTLTGTLRGLERDRMANPRQETGCPVFARFLPKPKADAPASEQWKVTPKEGTVYLVCTSAGEVGVDISADHMVCDLSTFDSMAQRFGRVNRRGEGAADIDVVYETDPDPKKKEDKFEMARWKTKEVLARLPRTDDRHDASPFALRQLKLSDEERDAAFAPTPTLLPVTDILFDAWALTTIRDKLPGRPPVEPYLHGVTDDQFDTEFAWREEVTQLTGKVDDKAIAELLDEFPLKPHETLKLPTFAKKGSAAADHLAAIAKRVPDESVWVVSPTGELTVYAKLSELSKQVCDENVSLAGRTVVLPPKAGGLTANGTLDGTQESAEGREYDVAGTPPAKVTPLLRLLVTPGEEGETVKPVGRVRDWPDDTKIGWKNRTFRIDGQLPLRVIYTLDLPDPNDEEAPPKRYVVAKPIQTRTGETPKAEWPALDSHLKGVAGFAEQIASRLKLDAKLAKAIELAAAWHDHGKARPVWQRGAGNYGKFTPVAKTLHGRPPENLNHYRHELGSMVDVSTRTDLAEQFDALDDHHKEVVLHLIATHHGRGRPHFPEHESHDLDRPNGAVVALTVGTPGRFARLQRRFGRWGLAYLESLVRAADVLESQRIESAPLPDTDDWRKAEPTTPPTLRPLVPQALPEASITVAVDPTNPGQFFACCGLLELADRLWPGAEGWFEKDGREFKIAFTDAKGTLRELLAILILDSPAAVERLENGLDVPTIVAPLAFSFDGGSTTGMILDGWTRIAVLRGVAQVIGNSPWNFWSGQQTSMRIWSGLRSELAAQLARMSDVQLVSLFDQRLFQKGRFGFDPGPAWNALDVGFSLNEHNIEVQSSPATEMLAAAGLQRFRPVMNDDRDGFDYFTWHSPYSPAVAAAAMAGAIRDSHTIRLRASVTSRGQYAALGFAFPLNSGDSDE